MSNINRDYLCILDVKTGAINAPKMYFYNTDRSTSNIYVQLVVKETIVSATPIENATDFVIEAKIIKPNGFVKEMTGQLVNEADAIYEFDLPEDFTDLTGINQVEFWVRAKVADREERITSASTKYTVKGSILNSIDDNIKDDNDYPIFLALMERVERLDKEVTEVSLATKVLNEEAKGELVKIKADEVEIANNEARRQEQEATRTTNEEARKTEELRRKADETARGEAETARESAEASRIAYENRRESQERDRVSNEYDRQNYEQDREYAENARQEAETARAGAEATRVTAENERKTQETLRQEAEVNRVTAEQAREASNTAMRQDITNMQNEINNFETATNREIEEIRTSVGQEIDTMKVIVENQNAKIDYIKENDRKQDILINGIFNSQDNKLTSTKEGNVHDLVESKPGLLYVDEIVGNTMVNCNKEADKSIVLSEAINVEGTNNITLTQGVDGAKADVYVEGNTMVNVCDQEDPVAITKSYTVEAGNHVALQGEYDGKCRPVVYGNTLVNLAKTFIRGTNTIMLDNKGLLKTNTVYTLITPSFDLNVNEMFVGYNRDNPLVGYQSSNIVSFNTGESILSSYIYCYYRGNDPNTYISNVPPQYIILEGDYTNKPIPDYFTGMQSSFEDKVVTQEMVDSGKELAENLGKYKVEYKVTGKNKINVSKTGELITIGSGGIQRYGFEFNKKGTFTLSLTNANNYNLAYKVKSGSTYSSYTAFTNNLTFTLNKDETLIVYVGNENTTLSDFGISNIQIEEGDTATAYEPYKEQVKTYYLNSPLLEGDTIEENSGNVYHVHRYNSITFDGSDDEGWYTVNSDTDIYIFAENIINSQNKGTNNQNRLMSNNFVSNKDMYDNRQRGIFLNNTGSIRLCLGEVGDVEHLKQWLQQNPTTIVYQLASPTYEVISQNDSILQDSYVNGHLDFDTAVPVERVKFNGILFKLKYWYPSTNYIVQFEADGIGKIDLLNINGNYTGGNIVKGLNKFTLTTPSTVVNNYMDIYGIGCNISNIVVTEATEGDFGYFKGMKSVGEQEGNKIEILSTNKNVLKLDGNQNLNCTVSNNIVTTDTLTGNYKWIKLDCNNQVLRKGYYIVSFDVEILSGTLTDQRINACQVHKYTGGNRVSTINITNIQRSMSSKIKFGFDVIKDTPIEHLFIQISGICTDVIAKITNLQIEKAESSSTENTTYVPHASNKKQILCEPLRKVGDIADRYVLIDGKWYIERNCGEVVLDGSENWCINNQSGDNGDYYLVYYKPLNIFNGYSWGNIVSNKFATYTGINESLWNTSEWINIHGWSFGIGINILKSKLSTIDVNGFKLWLQSNPVTVVYPLASPTYEPIDYNPLDIYSDTTHISINSNIPAKIKARNHGYNCMVKPSTTYTATYNVNGTPQKTTIVTPATLDDATRFTGTGTLDNFLLLEGDISNPPAFFSGMRSCFDQQYDEVKGKWKVNVRVEGNGTYNDITIYINEPLRKGDIIRAENRKILVERHSKEVVFDGSENWHDVTSWGAYNGKTIEFRTYSKFIDKKDTFLCNKFTYNKKINLWDFDFEGYHVYEPNSLDIRISKFKLPTQDVEGFKQWLSQNPVTVVYELASPVIEEVETDYTRLMLESYENATVYFNSHIFPTSTIRYQADVASVRSLMETNNEQDEVLNVSLMAIDESNTETGMLIDTLLLAVDELYTTLNPEEGGTLNE